MESLIIKWILIIFLASGIIGELSDVPNIGKPRKLISVWPIVLGTAALSVLLVLTILWL